jgi:hypothetical protein
MLSSACNLSFASLKSKGELKTMKSIRKRSKIEIMAYIHFNPLYRIVKKSANRLTRRRLAL